MGNTLFNYCMYKYYHVGICSTHRADKVMYFTSTDLWLLIYKKLLMLRGTSLCHKLEVSSEWKCKAQKSEYWKVNFCYFQQYIIWEFFHKYYLGTMFFFWGDSIGRNYKNDKLSYISVTIRSTENKVTLCPKDIILLSHIIAVFP